MQSIKPTLESWKNGLINQTKDTELCSIYIKHGSDKKGPNASDHNYTNLYYPLFQSIRNQAFNFFELGLGSHDTSIQWHFNYPGCKTGASMYAAEEFFPSASIYGADIDRNIHLNPGRIKTFFCDAKKADTIQAMWNLPELKDKSFEIIMDDGCHEFDANYCFAVNSLPKLAPQGLFVVEDMWEPEKWEKEKMATIDKFNLDVFEIIQMRRSKFILMQVK